MSFDKEYERIAYLEAENERLRAALEMIASLRPCLDNLMGDKDIAREALKQTHE